MSHNFFGCHKRIWSGRHLQYQTEPMIQGGISKSTLSWTLNQILNLKSYISQLKKRFLIFGVFLCCFNASGLKRCTSSDDILHTLVVTALVFQSFRHLTRHLVNTISTQYIFFFSRTILCNVCTIYENCSILAVSDQSDQLIWHQQP